MAARLVAIEQQGICRFGVGVRLEGDAHHHQRRNQRNRDPHSGKGRGGGPPGQDVAGGGAGRDGDPQVEQAGEGSGLDLGRQIDGADDGLAGDEADDEPDCNGKHGAQQQSSPRQSTTPG